MDVSDPDTATDSICLKAGVMFETGRQIYARLAISLGWPVNPFSEWQIKVVQEETRRLQRAGKAEIRGL
jgi:hypothetical protein